MCFSILLFIQEPINNSQKSDIDVDMTITSDFYLTITQSEGKGKLIILKDGDHMAGQKNKLTPLGKDIKKKLADKDMSQMDLAERVGTSKSYLSRIMRGGKSGEKYLTAICAVLDLNPDRYRASA